jgi:hypothetical protein
MQDPYKSPFSSLGLGLLIFIGMSIMAGRACVHVFVG